EQHAGTLHVDRGDDNAVDEPLHAEGNQEWGALEGASPTRLRQEDLDGGNGGGDRRAVRRPDQNPDEGGAAERPSEGAAVGGADDRTHQQEPTVESHPARCRPSHSTKSTPPVRLTRSRWSGEVRTRTLAAPGADATANAREFCGAPWVSRSFAPRRGQTT